jgi:hypothetical protein
VLIDLASRISFEITQHGCPNKVPVVRLETTASVVEVEIDFPDSFFFLRLWRSVLLYHVMWSVGANLWEDSVA